ADDQTVVAVRPGDSAIGAAEETTVAADIDRVRTSRLERNGVLIGMNRIPAGALVAQIAPGPGAAGEIAAVAFDGAAVDLRVAVRSGGEIPVVPGLTRAHAGRIRDGRPGAGGTTEQIGSSATGAPGIGDSGIRARDGDGQPAERSRRTRQRDAGPGGAAVG